MVTKGKKRRRRPQTIGSPGPRTVRVKPSSYQPSKAELEERVRINATPDELASKVMETVRVETEE